MPTKFLSFKQLLLVYNSFSVIRFEDCDPPNLRFYMQLLLFDLVSILGFKTINLFLYYFDCFDLDWLRDLALYDRV